MIGSTGGRAVTRPCTAFSALLLVTGIEPSESNFCRNFRDFESTRLCIERYPGESFRFSKPLTLHLQFAVRFPTSRDGDGRIAKNIPAQGLPRDLTVAVSLRRAFEKSRFPESLVFPEFTWFQLILEGKPHFLMLQQGGNCFLISQQYHHYSPTVSISSLQPHCECHWVTFYSVKIGIIILFLTGNMSTGHVLQCKIMNIGLPSSSNPLHAHKIDI